MKMSHILPSSRCYKLTANKTKLYALVKRHYENLPPMRATQFIKYPRTRDYALDFYDGSFHHFFFSVCAGIPSLAHRIEIYDEDGDRITDWDVISLEMSELHELALLEEVAK